VIDAARHGPWGVITGGSEGIGAAFAHQLGDVGINVILVARREGPLAETAADIRVEWLEGANVVGLTASASAPEILVQQVVDFARTRLGIDEIEELDTVREDVHFSLPHELTAMARASS